MKKLMIILVMLIMCIACNSEISLQKQFELKARLTKITMEYEQAVLNLENEYWTELSSIPYSNTQARQALSQENERKRVELMVKFKEEQARIIKELNDMGVYE